MPVHTNRNREDNDRPVIDRINCAQSIRRTLLAPAMRVPVSFLPLVMLLAVPPAAAEPMARALDDPLATEAGLPLRPSPALAGRTGAAPCADALPATPLGIIDVVDLALCNNAITREAWANARVQAAGLGVAQAAWLPSLDAQGSLARAWSEGTGHNQRSAALTLSWLLFDFGTRAANVENARQLLAAAAASQDANVQSLFLAALQAYYGVQAGRASVEAQKEAERAARESFAAADTRYRVGVATPADRLQAQTAASQASLNRIRAEGDLKTAYGSLANVMGFDAQQAYSLADIPILVPDAGFSGDLATLIGEARQRRPDLRAAEAQLAAAQAGVAAARGAGLPTLSLGAGPTWQEIGGVSSHGGSVGLSLNVPLFSGFTTTYRVRAASAQAEVREAQRQRLEKQVALDVWKAYQGLLTSSETLKTTADLVASAEASAAVTLGRYKAGVGSILDVLSAQSALASARQQRIQSALDWNVNRATLAQAMGTLDYGLLEAAGEGKR